jgi:glyoxylate reductase
MSDKKPRVIADAPDQMVLDFMADRVELLPWDVAVQGSDEHVDGIYTYSHPHVDGAMIDRLNGIRIVSNYGVGVDHINVKEVTERGIPVGNTPGVLNGATADMGIALMMAAARRVAEGDRYARSPEFLVHDPGFMWGREVHSSTLGIVGMGAIGQTVAKRAKAFDMEILYHNRSRRPEAEAEYGATYCSLDELLAKSDYVMLCCPLTAETKNMIGAAELAKMKSTATLVNIARGGVVDTTALYEALRDKVIWSAGLDVTEPEPLPRHHPMLSLDNVTMVPHFGSATVQTRMMMAKNSVENLMRGLRGEELLNNAPVL